MRLSPNPVKAVLAVVLTLMAAPAAAYSAFSFSHRAGVFLVSDSPVPISFDTPEQLQTLREHCNRGKPVYTGADEPFRCTVRNTPPDDDRFYGQTVVEVQGRWPKQNGAYCCAFSFRPQTTRWASRPLTDAEKAALPALLEADPARHGRLWRELKLDTAIAVSRPGGVHVTYLVPGKRFEDPYAGEPSQRHHVFVGHGESYRYQGHIPDAPRRFHDLDGDDIPELFTDTPCDGLCVDLWEVHSRVRPVASVSGH